MVSFSLLAVPWLSLTLHPPLANVFDCRVLLPMAPTLSLLPMIHLENMEGTSELWGASSTLSYLDTRAWGALEPHGCENTLWSCHRPPGQGCVA